MENQIAELPVTGEGKWAAEQTIEQVEGQGAENIGEAPEGYLLVKADSGEIVKELNAGEFYLSERKKKKNGKPERTYKCANGKVITPHDDNTLVLCRYASSVIFNAAEMKYLSKELDAAELGVIATLSQYLSYHANIITVGRESCFTIGDIAQLCSVSLPTFRRIYSKLNGMIILISSDSTGTKKTRQWQLNPFIVHKGRFYNLATRELFKKYKMRSKNMKEWGSL